MLWSAFFRSFPISLFFLLLPIRSFSSSGGSIVINEIYYDHPGSDEGWEYVELINSAKEYIELSGWKLEFVDGSSGKSKTIWTADGNLRIAPGEIVLIAQSKWSPVRLFELVGNLENGPDAVRLLSPSGVEDVLGYGDLSLPDLFESHPAPDVPAGRSLSRKPDGEDTDANDVDFVASNPTPGLRNFFSLDVSPFVVLPEKLPCAGSFFPIILRICNVGLARFDGTVSIDIVVAGSGYRDSCHVNLNLGLPSGSCDSLVATLRAPNERNFSLRASISTETDENRENDSQSMRLYASPSDVVVNEIMYRPNIGESEWIELVCRSELGCDLAGWTIRDSGGKRRMISRTSLFVPAFCYLILAEDSVSFARTFPDCDAVVARPEGGLPALNDSGEGEFTDLVSIEDSSGCVVEYVTYKDLLGSERGRSIERVSMDACSSLEGGIWHRCAAESGATAGRENSVGGETKKGSKRLSISPNPFSSASGACALIEAHLSKGESGIRIRIFSLEGLEVKRLFGEIGGASTVICRWDGRDEASNLVPTGIYICLAEYMCGGGGVCRREKCCIVVVRGS